MKSIDIRNVYYALLIIVGFRLTAFIGILNSNENLFLIGFVISLIINIIVYYSME